MTKLDLYAQTSGAHEGGMRRSDYAMPPEAALQLLAESPVVHLAAVKPDGMPLFRTVHGVVVDGALAFHGAPKGEKSEAAGWASVAVVEETVASIPSYFVDPERACPATTYYRSVHAKGVLEEVEDQEARAKILQALMEKLQPEGGHTPITASDPLYTNAVRNLLILRLPLTEVTGKAKLGQNRRPEERAKILEALWRRGAPADARAVELVRAASPDTPTPPFLEAPPGVRLRTQLGPADLEAAVALVAGEYWNRGVSPERLRRAHLGSAAWVGAEESSTGQLIATARASSDGGKVAWVFDVGVAPQWRRRGVGQAVLRLLLDHPAVRGVMRVCLGTLDAQRFYQRFGFEERASTNRTPGSSTMILER